MASDFIGYTILVTLQHPPHAQLQGVVENVVDQKLYLQNVLLLWNGQRLPSYILESSAIADLEVAPSQPITQAPTTSITSRAEQDGRTTKPPQPHTRTQIQTQPSAFVDPAILSYSKPGAVKNGGRSTAASGAAAQQHHQQQPQQQPVSPIMIADGAVPSPVSHGHRTTIVKQSSVSSMGTTQLRRGKRRDSDATAILTEPFDAMALKDEVGENDNSNNNNNNNHGELKKKKILARRSKDMTQSQTAPGIIDVRDLSSPLKPTTKKAGKGKGWRQTPLIEEIPKPATITTVNTTKKVRGRKVAQEDVNGWATEDATDIQELGDFDFESNLNKFDKRRVFDDIRRDDNTADDERLVSFNRKPKPGTNGGRNLHFTENVLDVPDTNKDRWKSEAGETEDDDDAERREEPYSSGRGSRRAGSKRPLQSRKGSALPGHFERTDSPRPLTRMPTGSPLNGSVSGLRASFRLHNNKPCHYVSPLQMLEIEQLCTSEMGLTEDMLSENAGRSIAEAVLRSQPDVRSVVLLVGNHKSGARSVAAARHLRNRRLRVTVVVLGGEREELLLEIMRKQLAIYKRSQGYVDRWDEYQTKVASGGGPPPDVIVDALLGVHVAFDELRTDDQATAFEMIRWAGRLSSNSKVLSIDVPSGLSATSGLITEAEGQLLVMNSSQVIALGAPKTGLLHAMAMDGVEATNWQVLVADIGISSAAWQKHGSRRKHGIDFGNDWLVPVKFVSG